MKNLDRGAVFLGIMSVICVAALGIAILRGRQHAVGLRQLRDHNEALKKADGIAQSDAELQTLMAKQNAYAGSVDQEAEPVKIITDSAAKRGLTLDRIDPRTPVARAGKAVQETPIEVHEADVEVPALAELLFFLEEAYPGSIVVKEMTLTRKKGEETLWDARVTLSHFVEKPAKNP